MVFDSWMFDFGRAVGEYINMSVDEALRSPHPTVQALTFLDRKMGVRRLENVNIDKLHNFPRMTYVLRCEAEHISVQR